MLTRLRTKVRKAPEAGLCDFVTVAPIGSVLEYRHQTLGGIVQKEAAQSRGGAGGLCGLRLLCKGLSPAGY